MLLMVRTIAIFVISIFYLVFVKKFASLYLADVYYAASRHELEDGQLGEAGDHIIKAIKLNAKEPAYFRQRAKILLATMIWVDDGDEIRESTLDDLEKAQELNPHNLATLRNSIPLYYFLAADDEQTYVPVTRDYYKELKDVYQNDLGMYADVARYEKRLGLEDEFENTKQKARELRPDVLEWHESFTP